MKTTARQGTTMHAPTSRYIYGPVSSRRLGRSLGVDLVPFKTCNYDCIYCQLGRGERKVLKRRDYAPIDAVSRELQVRLVQGDPVDHITLAGSGEPTLNVAIGRMIRRIKEMTDIPVAVLTNGSLLWVEDVQEDLMSADVVLPSLDAGCERLFRRVNRPHRRVRFAQLVDGLTSFTRNFPGAVWLEVFLIEGMTSSETEVGRIAELVRWIAPARVQLNTVARPPAEQFALPVPREKLSALKDLFERPVEIISENDTAINEASVGGARRVGDMLALLERRPCTAKDVARGLGIHVTEALKCLSALLAAGKVSRSVAEESIFYHSTLRQASEPG